MIASRMAEACAAAGAGYVFKASYDKANRTSLSGKRGVGMDAGLDILAEVKARIGCPVLTDVHTPSNARPQRRPATSSRSPPSCAARPTFLLAAGETGAVINVKKGQFLAPWDMANVAAKVASTGNDSILLTERGAASATTRSSPTCGRCRK
jgi:2-dehydro-3-deoxyphosphooctonate aldolase (KDO 8-P synthase)